MNVAGLRGHPRLQWTLGLHTQVELEGTSWVLETSQEVSERGRNTLTFDSSARPIDILVMQNTSRKTIKLQLQLVISELIMPVQDTTPNW